MARTVYHIVPVGKQWGVRREGESLIAAKLFDTKALAEIFARLLADETKPSQIKVHKQDGKIETEWTYGDDPRKTPG